MDEEQAYQFACEGYFVVKSAISPAQVAELLREAKAEEEAAIAPEQMWGNLRRNQAASIPP